MRNIKFEEMKLKWKLNKLEKKYYQDLFEKNKNNLSKKVGAIRSIVNGGRKSKRTPCSLKHNGALLFNSVKITGTFNFSLQILDLTLQKEFLQENNHLWHLNDKILKSFYFCPDTPNTIIINLDYYLLKIILIIIY